MFTQISAFLNTYHAISTTTFAYKEIHLPLMQTFIHRTPTNAAAPTNSPKDAGVKRKLNSSSHIGVDDQNAVVKKKQKQVYPGVSKAPESNPTNKRKKAKRSSPQPVEGKLLKKHRKKDDASEDDSSGQDEATSRSRRLAPVKASTHEHDSDDTDAEDELSRLDHESLSAPNKSKKKAKYIPPEETPEQRDARTIFIGNLPVELAQKKPLVKRLRHYILTHVESVKIESIRFRSIPLRNAISKQPNLNDSGSDVKAPKHRSRSDPVPKSIRLHDLQRISSWREKQGHDDDAPRGDQKIFLTPQQKRKIAYINKEFHGDADTVNAYVVFAHPPPVEPRPSNLPSPPTTMDPYQAAKTAVEKCNGTTFMGRTIRVDHVFNPDKSNNGGAGDGNPKLSVFVGNLDFSCKEDDLRWFFEGLINSERGPAMAEDNDDDGIGTDSRKSQSWVAGVRIIRDRNTQLGKGFAYVQFADRECVDEVLSLDATRLAFAKRTLRVQRCKTLPSGSSSLSTGSAKVSSKSSHLRLVPKGDPELGQKLAHLSKDARKQYKASDPDRVARRLAKKKARLALEKNRLSFRVKDRERVRTTSTAKSLSAPRKERKHRVRSEKSLAKQNIKK